MIITYTGTNSYFFNEAFFDSNATDSLDSIEVTSPREVVTTTVVVENFATGFITTITGTNLYINADGNPTQGTITGMSFSQGGVVQGTITNISWDFVAFLGALLDIEATDDHTAMAALINAGGPVTIDASGAAFNNDFGMDMLTAFGGTAPLVTQPITIIGSPYSDALFGGLGNDTISPGANAGGQDNILASPGDDTIIFTGATPESFYELFYSNASGGLTVTLDGATNTGSVQAPSYTDTLTDINAALRADGLSIQGSAFADTFTAAITDGSWLNLSGGEGSDNFTLTITDSIVRLSYNSGADSSPTQGLVINLGTGVVGNDGFGFTDTLSITRNGDSAVEVRGTRHADNMTGGPGNDRFIPEGGDDTINGGAGVDLLRFDRSGVGPVSVDLVNGTATGTWNGSPFSLTLSGIDYVRGSRGGNDTLLGSYGADTLVAFGGDDQLDGLGGNDSLVGGDGADTGLGGFGFDTIEGGAGNDHLEGQGNADSLYGEAGEDTLEGGDGFDQLYGGDDDDVLDAGAEPDRLYGGEGNDVLRGGSNFSLTVDGLFGEGGNDTLYGEGGFDYLNGGPGDDLLDGGHQADNLYGEDGNDTLLGDLGLDRLFGGIGDDSLVGGAGNDGHFGEAGNDTMQGGTGNDRFYGGPGNDLIEGGADEDTIYGNAGFDTIDGGTGNDLLFGRFNADTFVFADGHGVDTVGDFDALNALEKIDLSAVSAITGLADLNLGSPTTGAATQVGADVVIDTGGGNSIRLTGISLGDLDAGDFIF